MSKPFKFKKFSVEQDQCAMKIGTDGVLLGAWTALENNPDAILDIGAGTGIVSLMLAQRSTAEVIDALEIDGDAYEQCVNNFEQSPWGDRLFCYHASLEEFANDMEETYDLIVANPPFYSEDYKTENLKRDTARFQDAMPFSHLIESVSKLLDSDGAFSVIIPFKEETFFISLAKKYNLFPTNIMHIKGNKNAEIKRSLINLSFRANDIHIEELVIETERHQYTDAYVNLTKDFYLKL